MAYEPKPEAEEAARVLVSGALKRDPDSIAAALTIPLEAWIVDTHREVMRALRVLHEQGVTNPEMADFLRVIDPSICGGLELSNLAVPESSATPKARAETLRGDFARRQLASKAASFASIVPHLTPDDARVELDALLRSLEFTADGWPVPDPLPDTAHAVEPFAPELLPEAFRAFVMDVSDRMQCPPDFPAVAMMVALGSLVGRQCGIRPKRNDDWTVVPNLWGGVVGSPSVKKTPALQPAVGLLDRLDQQRRKEFEDATAEYNRTLEVQEVRAKAARKAAGKAADDGKDDAAIREALIATKVDCAPPIRRRYMTNDPTVEKLGELLRDNRNGLLVFRDEMMGWLRSFEREGRESDRAFYLEAWNGTNRFNYDRIGRGHIAIDAACVSILGGIQPGPLIEYFRAALQNGAGADGLMQRFQLLVWPDITREFYIVDRLPNNPARDSAFAVFERLNNLGAETVSAEVDEWGGIPFLRFAHDAQDEFYRWQLEFNQRVRAGEDSDPLTAHLLKYESMVAALALLIHLADTQDGGPVSRVALDGALGWADYLETHARRVYGSCIRGELDAARALLQHVGAGDLPVPFTAKDAYKNHWSGLSREAVEGALAVLEDYGWVRGRKMDTGGRSTVHFTPHPSLRKGR